MIFIISLIGINFMLILATLGYTTTSIVLYYILTIFGFILISNDRILRNLQATLDKVDPNSRNNSDYIWYMQNIEYEKMRANIIGSTLIHIGIVAFLLKAPVLVVCMVVLLYVRYKNSIENERFYK